MNKPCAAILGDGAWGTALALVLLRNGHRVRVWGPFPDQIEAIRGARENTAFLPGVALPPEIEWTADREAAVRGAGLVVLAVPTRYFRDAVGGFAGLVPAGARAVSVRPFVLRDVPPTSIACATRPSASREMKPKTPSVVMRPETSSVDAGSSGSSASRPVVPPL